jgi:hypothetical protein
MYIVSWVSEEIKGIWRNMNRDSDRRSASPPPEAQFNLNGRLVFGIIEPFKDKALAAAAGEAKSIKQ